MSITYAQHAREALSHLKAAAFHLDALKFDSTRVRSASEDLSDVIEQVNFVAAVEFSSDLKRESLTDVQLEKSLQRIAREMEA